MSWLLALAIAVTAVFLAVARQCDMEDVTGGENTFVIERFLPFRVELVLPIHTILDEPGRGRSRWLVPGDAARSPGMVETSFPKFGDHPRAVEESRAGPASGPTMRHGTSEMATGTQDMAAADGQCYNSKIIS